MSSFGTSVLLREEGEYSQIYQRVRAYLNQHFSRLPKVDLYYDAKGAIQSERQNHEIVKGGLVVVQIHRHDGNDAIGLLCLDNSVELDAVSAGCKSELRTWYGYHD